MEGSFFSLFPKDYGGHIDSEIMGYLFTNNFWPTTQPI